jgi:hypothetical protein
VHLSYTKGGHLKLIMSFSVAITPEWFVQKASFQQGTPVGVPSADLDTDIAVTVYPHWYSHASVSWAVPEKWGNCVFRVFSQDGSEVKELTTAPVSNPFFLDTSLRETSKFHSLAYIVEAILLDFGNQTRRSPPVSWNYKRRGWVEMRFNEIQRREFLLLSKFVGVKSYLFKRRLYGERCPRCWSTSTEVNVDDHCPVCYGTSFKGGYFDPQPLFLQYDSTPNNRQVSYIGRAEPNQIGAWTISMPEICPDDVVIRTGDWNVYRVSRNTPTELQTNTVRQIVTLTQFSKGDIENALAKRIEDPLRGAYLEVLPSGTPRESPVEGVQERVPYQQLSTDSGNPDWLNEMSQETLPAKYDL